MQQKSADPPRLDDDASSHRDVDAPTPDGFDSPVATPTSADHGKAWQEANRDWWESNPMRYDWREALGVEEFSEEFYDEIDRRFFEVVATFMPWKRVPFDNLIDFDALGNKDVLEIGVGNGSHAQLLAQHAKSYNGVDLTDYAIHSTTKRLEVRGLSEHATLTRMDAENLEFPDESFDFVWSWGVIHHSSHTEKIVQQIKRVLRPGGRAKVMVYHRNWWNYYVASALLRGIIQGQLFKGMSLHEILQGSTDGAIARFYSIDEWKKLISPHLTVEDVEIHGPKTDLVLIPASPFKDALLKATPNGLSRLLTHRGRLGTFLVSTIHKDA